MTVTPRAWSRDKHGQSPVQFTNRAALVMTIIKAQGANLITFEFNDPVLSHGQFYVALSQIASQSNIFVATIFLIEDTIT